MTKRKISNMGNFHKIISSLIITILFIPLVFMGANVFFPKFDSYNEFKPCYPPRPTGLTAERSIEFDEENRKCMEESEAKRKVWQEEKNQYDSWKYIFIVAVCLVALLAALFIPMAFNIKMGLFIGAAISAFASTLIYFGTKSKMGFALLVILFIIAIFFVNKERKK